MVDPCVAANVCAIRITSCHPGSHRGGVCYLFHPREYYASLSALYMSVSPEGAGEELGTMHPRTLTLRDQDEPAGLVFGVR